MGLFTKKENILGIDLGSTSIKIVELKKSKTPSLVTYGYLEKASGDILKGEKEKVKKETAEMLKFLCQKAKVTTNLAVTALPSFSVFTSTITLPIKLSKKELYPAVVSQTKKLISIPFEEAVLDWKILEKEKDYKILIHVTSKKLIREYLEIFKLANLNLLSLETESFALSRALVGKDPAVIMIVDFSAISTDVIVVEKTIPVFHRSINLGGLNLTEEISKVLGIDFKMAEQFKRDLSALDKIPNFLEDFLKQIVEEVDYSIRSYKNQTQKNIEKIILSGGSAYLPNLDKYFSDVLKMKVIIGNPFKRVSYPEEIEPALHDVAPRFSVAIGLALK